MHFLSFYLALTCDLPNCVTTKIVRKKSQSRKKKVWILHRTMALSKSHDPPIKKAFVRIAHRIPELSTSNTKISPSDKDHRAPLYTMAFWRMNKRSVYTYDECMNGAGCGGHIMLRVVSYETLSQATYFRKSRISAPHYEVYIVLCIT